MWSPATQSMVTLRSVMARCASSGRSARRAGGFEQQVEPSPIGLIAVQRGAADSAELCEEFAYVVGQAAVHRTIGPVEGHAVFG